MKYSFRQMGSDGDQPEDKPDASNPPKEEVSRQHHHLKTETEYYQSVESGEKKFELRKNDRDFKRYDMVYLHEVVKGEYTGRELPPFEIKYILEGGKYGLPKGYCIFNW